VLKVWRAVAVALAGLALVLGFVVVVQAMMLHAQGWRVAMGTMPDWLVAAGAVATVGTLVVALLVYLRDANTARRQQAEAILAWTGSQRNLYAEVIRGQGSIMASTVEVNLLNASPAVLYDLVVVVLGRHAPTATLVNVGDQGMSALREDWEQRRDRLAAGRAKVLPAGSWQVRVKLAHPSVIADEVHLFYRDQRGVYWWRDPGGQVSEYQPPPPDDRSGEARIRQIADTLGEGPTNARIGILVPKPLRDAEAT
jgi:hypothetical protein